MRELPQSVTTLVRRRGGIVTRAELLAAGLSDNAIRWRRQQWVTVFAGIYAVSAAPGTDPRDLPLMSRVWAGLLHAGEGALVAGRAAARLEGLIGEEPRVIDISVPRNRRVRSRAGWRFVRRRPGVLLDPRPGHPPRQRVEDTVLYLSAASTNVDGCMSPLLDAVQRGRTTADLLRHRLTLRTRHPHRQLLHALLDDMASGTTTHLELRYARDVESAHGLPVARRQARQDGTGAICDVEYDGFDVLVELDGRKGHVGDGRFRDMDRDNAHTVLGKATLRYGWRQVATVPCTVAAQVATALQRRGWTGETGRCSRCREAADEAA